MALLICISSPLKFFTFIHFTNIFCRQEMKSTNYKNKFLFECFSNKYYYPTVFVCVMWSKLWRFGHLTAATVHILSHIYRGDSQDIHYYLAVQCANMATLEINPPRSHLFMYRYIKFLYWEITKSSIFGVCSIEMSSIIVYAEISGFEIISIIFMIPEYHKIAFFKLNFMKLFLATLLIPCLAFIKFKFSFVMIVNNWSILFYQITQLYFERLQFRQIMDMKTSASTVTTQAL